MHARRDGFVIALTLMVLLLLELLAAGMLVLALQERAVATSRSTLTHATARAESELARQVGDWETAGLQQFRVGEARVIADDTTTSRIERLRGDLFLLTAETLLEPGNETRGSARASLLLRTFDPQLLLRQITGAVVVGGPVQLLGATTIDASSAAAACSTSGATAAVATPFPELLSIASSVALAGRPEILLDTFPREPPTRTGGLDLDELADLATRTAAGAITPAPVTRDGRCDETAPANWGAPLDPQHACADYFPFVFADGDLDITGGSGQGLLIVTGNLIMRGNAAFHGLVIVGGTVFVSGAAITGALYARSAAASAILLDSSVRLNACAVENVLLSVRSLRKPLFPPGRIWLPAH